MPDPIWNGLARLLPRGTKIGSFFHFCQTSSTQKQYEGPTVKQSQFPSVSPISKDPRECKYEKKKKVSVNLCPLSPQRRSVSKDDVAYIYQLAERELGSVLDSSARGD